MTCTGFEDDLPSTGLGFPEVIPESDDEAKDQRDDNIEMNQGIIYFYFFIWIC